jgi:hypothetical protein
MSLLIDGRYVSVPGCTVIAPGRLPVAANDYGRRATSWVRQVTIHTTQGKDPQIIKPGGPPRPGDRAAQIARYWSTSSTPGCAPLIVDGDSIACLFDLVKYQGYHATTVNPWSVGIEMVQEPDGTIYEDTLDATVRLVLVLCDALGIPLQTTDRVYRSNTIIERLRFGGSDVVGVFGHRDNAWRFPQHLNAATLARYPSGYADRGRGDPGDEIYRRLRRAGAMSFDFDGREEIAWWMRVQRALGLGADGVCGPGTVAELRRRGLWSGGVFAEAPIP